jgi:uncharacterized protein YjbI with pentapeptide repeats
MSDRHERTEAEEALAEGAPPEAQDGAEESGKKKGLPEIPIAERATITCRADLQRVLAAHAQWIEGVFDPKVEVAAGRANLSGADLRDYDLSGVNLSGANLSGANLQGCEMIGANLTVANLQGAQLQCANLRNARLLRAKVDGADLRGADLTDAVLTGVDLAKAILRSAGGDEPETEREDPIEDEPAAAQPPPDAPEAHA